MSDVVKSVSDTGGGRSGGPCSGIRVIDASSIVSGPFCSQILADLGAEVIRIESPGSDPLRMTAPLHKGQGAYFEQANRGKKSIAVDLKNEGDRTIVHDLVRGADIFLQNSRPGVMERLGFGYDELCGLNERLIYLSINGFGESGPFVKRPAFDTVIQGLVGFMPIQAGGGGSGAIRSPVADKITGMWAGNAALAALLDRERNGGFGQKVVVDMASAYASFTLLDNLSAHTFPDATLPEPYSLFGPYRALPTTDGEVIGLILQPSHCKALARAMGRDDIADDPRFSSPMGVIEHNEVLYDAIAPAVQKMTTREFLEVMDRDGVPFGRVNTIAEFVASPEAEAAKVFTETHDDELGRIRHINYPGKFSRATVGAKGRAPRLGEHNEELLRKA